MSIDWDLQLALEEVDALLPGTPKVAPPRPPMRRIVGSFVDGAYAVLVDAMTLEVLLSEGRRVTRAWFEMNRTSPARA